MVNHDANQVMSRDVVKVGWDLPLSDAYQTMQSKRIRHLPVMDSGGRVIGIVSDRDLNRAMQPLEGNEVPTEFDFKFATQGRVVDVMSSPVLCVPEHLSLREVAKLMIEEKKSALIVVNYAEIPVGIVTTDDLLRFLMSMLEKDPFAHQRAIRTFIDEWGELDGYSE